MQEWVDGHAVPVDYTLVEMIGRFWGPLTGHMVLFVSGVLMGAIAGTPRRKTGTEGKRSMIRILS
jgi:hypothetical protein